MKTHYALPAKPQKPVVLTIGNFDGVHRGHQKVLKALCEYGNRLGLPANAITFSNHPATVLNPGSAPLLLCTREHKEQLLKEAGIESLYMIPFTKELSEQTPEEFIDKLLSVMPFKALVLGSDATIGKGREGTQEVLSQLAKKFGFSLEYIADETIDGRRISSRGIRECIQKGSLEEASKMLGRPYSILGHVVRGGGRGAQIGFHTANITVDGLCLPPLGVYAVIAHVEGKSYPGVANLGRAPTVKNVPTPVLEVHIFDKHLDLYDSPVEVEFRNYLRPEQKFDSIESLKQQISHDIAAAKSLLI